MSLTSEGDPFGNDLLRDEEVLWSGRPELSNSFTRADFLLIPFSIFWTLFSLFWMGVVLAIGISGEPGAFIMAVFGFPFVAIGFYMLFGRFRFKRWAKTKTHYAVTSKRVLSLSEVFGRHLNAAYIDRIPSIQTSEAKAGVGTIWFGNTPWWVAWYGNSGMEFLGWGWMYGEPAITFYDIKDVRQVVTLVDQIRSG